MLKQVVNSITIEESEDAETSDSVGGGADHSDDEGSGSGSMDDISMRTIDMTSQPAISSSSGSQDSPASPLSSSSSQGTKRRRSSPGSGGLGPLKRTTAADHKGRGPPVFSGQHMADAQTAAVAAARLSPTHAPSVHRASSKDQLMVPRPKVKDQIRFRMIETANFKGTGKSNNGIILNMCPPFDFSFTRMIWVFS